MAYAVGWAFLPTITHNLISGNLKSFYPIVKIRPIGRFGGQECPPYGVSVYKKVSGCLKYL
ncbi:MAG: hypothetical protein J5680_05405 [Neisseriaceae bacterium]|nr:hypothetical protein [Neisseriaceae bacterium]